MSAKRRANGESTIYQDSDGVWHAWCTVGTLPSGKLDRRHRRGKSRKEVLAKLRELEQARDTGAVTTAGADWTVTSWITHVLDVVKAGSLSLNTERSYRAHLEQWITPNIGAVPLARLRIDQVEAMFGVMRQAGVGRVSCDRVKATLRLSLNLAMRRGLLARNVAALAEVPGRGRESDPATPLSAQEAQRVLTIALTRPDAPRWALAMLGLRPAEVLGTDWSAIDLEGGWITVRQQLVAVYPYRHGCSPADAACRAQKALHCPNRIGGRYLKAPKSSAGVRRLHMPPPVLAAFRAHRQRWLAKRLRAGSAWSTQWGDLVFCTDVGTPIDHRKDRETWFELLERANVPGRRLYDARHSAATLMLEQGADLQQVKDQLGHSQISITSRYYLHATDVLAKDSAARLGAALFGTAAES